MADTIETTVYDMKTNFSKYASMLESGEVEEIIVNRRSTPLLRITRYEQPVGLRGFGMAKDLGWTPFDDELFDALDAEIEAEFEASRVFPEGDV